MKRAPLATLNQPGQGGSVLQITECCEAGSSRWRLTSLLRYTRARGEEVVWEHVLGLVPVGVGTFVGLIVAYIYGSSESNQVACGVAGLLVCVEPPMGPVMSMEQFLAACGGIGGVVGWFYGVWVGHRSGKA